MSDTPSKAREMLAAEYRAVGFLDTALTLLDHQESHPWLVAALRAVEKALTPPMSDAEEMAAMKDAYLEGWIRGALYADGPDDSADDGWLKSKTRAALAALASTDGE